MESRTNPITFITWLWHGWRPGTYCVKHVWALYRMLKEHAPEHRLCVVTDDRHITKYLPNDVLVYPMWDHPLPEAPGMKQNCFARLKLFDPDFGPRFGPRVVSVDLDVLIQDDIRPLFENEVRYRAVRGESAVFNGTMWELQTGSYPEVWTDFIKDPEFAIRELEIAKENGGLCHGSDQGWMSLLLEGVGYFWDDTNGVYHWSQEKYYDVRHRLLNARMICFAGGVKPWDDECKRITPEIHKRYMEYYDA